ncbi:MAG: dihydrolipoyl dehydrogenase family protein [Gemmatimonadota bacterium]
MRDPTYDIIVVGGGTAGLVTAAGCVSLGARTALVERDRLGGECLWTGCVPSKAMIGSARLAERMRRSREFGLPPAEVHPDGASVLESVRAVRARIQPHDDPARFRAMGVEVLEGDARFLTPHEIEVGGRGLRGRRFVIATGSRPAIPPIPGLDETGYFTHETAFDRPTIPSSVIIVGGGAIGIEFAQAYRRLGTRVCVVEMLERILPREDPEVVERLREVLAAEEIPIFTGCRGVKATRSEKAELEAVPGGSTPGAPSETIRADEIFVATGRRPNVEELGLETAGVEAGREGIIVDARLRTSRRHIFAAGDVIGGHLFTHVADHEARAVVRNVLFPFARPVRYDAVPWCTFTDPELAHVGLTEPEARERFGDRVRTYVYDIETLDRAITDRAATGCVKLVTDRRGRLLGGHILAPSAGTMIMEVAVAVRHGLKIGALSRLVHPYPTMGEGVRRAADMYYRGKLTERSRRWLDRYAALRRRVGR